MKTRSYRVTPHNVPVHVVALSVDDNVVSCFEGSKRQCIAIGRAFNTAGIVGASNEYRSQLNERAVMQARL